MDYRHTQPITTLILISCASLPDSQRDSVGLSRVDGLGLAPFGPAHPDLSIGQAEYEGGLVMRPNQTCHCTLEENLVADHLFLSPEVV